MVNKISNPDLSDRDKKRRSMRVRYFKCGIFFLILFCLSSLTQAEQAPNFVAKDLDGKKVELKEVLEGGPVLISFWATWCKPCIKELGELQKVYKKYKAAGFEILAVDVDGPRSISKVRTMVQGLKWEFPVLWDESKEIYRRYQVLGIPHTVLIDGSGEIRYTHTTYRPGDEQVIMKKIEELLKEKKEPSEEKEGEKGEK
ncbi:MAG: TlpA family protein disulfide reductase [candidate division Zixibacteria bacterium]|nr:TlpA family protein disulfide reductase [candidate division Zixibacteria bacterium]